MYTTEQTSVPNNISTSDTVHYASCLCFIWTFASRSTRTLLKRCSCNEKGRRWSCTSPHSPGAAEACWGAHSYPCDTCDRPQTLHLSLACASAPRLLLPMSSRLSLTSQLQPLQPQFEGPKFRCAARCPTASRGTCALLSELHTATT